MVLVVVSGVVVSQSSLKRVLVSEFYARPVQQRNKLQVAILFEASPGFGDKEMMEETGLKIVGRNPL